MNNGVTPNIPSEWESIIAQYRDDGYTIEPYKLGKEASPQSATVSFSLSQGNSQRTVYFCAPVASTPEEFSLFISDAVYGYHIIYEERR